MNPDDAKGYIVTHDNRVKQLDRMPVAKLRETFALAQKTRGLVTVFGGPRTKDEFVRDIIDLEFPDIRYAREVYVNSVVV